MLPIVIGEEGTHTTVFPDLFDRKSDTFTVWVGVHILHRNTSLLNNYDEYDMLVQFVLSNPFDIATLPAVPA